MSMVHKSVGNNVEVHSQCFCWLLWVGKRLLAEVWMVPDTKLRMRDLEGLCNNLPAPREKDSLNRKPLKKKQSR